MTTVSSRKDVLRDSLAELLQNLWDKHSGYAMAFLFDRAEFMEYDPIKLQTWERTCCEGYLFDDTAEVHWRLQTDDVFVVVVTDDNNCVPAGFDPLPGSETWAQEQTDENVFLWGKYPPFPRYSDPVPKWFEQRIPRMLEYPHKAQERVKAIVRCYAENGRICYRRFVALT